MSYLKDLVGFDLGLQRIRLTYFSGLFMISVLWALAPAAFAPPIPFLCILSRCGWRCGSWLALSWPTTPRSTLACRGEYSEAPLPSPLEDPPPPMDSRLGMPLPYKLEVFEEVVLE